MFVSEYFQLNNRLKELGVFDSLLDKDSHFFINLIRLKNSAVPEFKEAYNYLNSYFEDIATLLEAADEPGIKDRMFREAERKFAFHEVNGINLGFAESAYGAGFGEQLSKQVLRDAYQIVKKGSRQPEIFHLVGLFEDNVAADRLSDMIASIIEPYIKRYTFRVMEELTITPDNYPDCVFMINGLVKNPFKNAPILLLPLDVIHELPIAQSWYDIDRVARENEIIRREISDEVGEIWKKWASTDKKAYIREHVFMEPETCGRVIDGYRNISLGAYNPLEKPEYLAEVVLKELKSKEEFSCRDKYISSYEAAIKIINIFKDWVENNKGWDLLRNVNKGRIERTVQSCLYLGAKYFVEQNNLDMSPETNSGRGPVDFKLSRGNDKTLIEIKLSSSHQLTHGYKEQVPEYQRAEGCCNAIFLLIDVGNPDTVKNLKELHSIEQKSGRPCPELIVIDAKEKRAASAVRVDS